MVKLRTKFFVKKGEFTKRFLVDFPNASKKEINSAFFSFMKWLASAENDEEADMWATGWDDSLKSDIL